MAASSKRRDVVELAIAYGLILTVIWTPRPLQRILWLVAAAAIVIIVCSSHESLKAMGLRTANFFRSLWVVGAALGCAIVAASIAARMHTLRIPGGPLQLVANYWAYAVWAGVQQFLLQCFFLSRLTRLLPNRKQAAFAAAALFASAHLPNPVLVTLTAIWGPLACLIFLRYRNLYSLALAHAILGVMVGITVPGTVSHNMRVGLGYLRYRPSQHRQPLQRIQSDQIASTEAWVTAEAPTRRSLRHARP